MHIYFLNYSENTPGKGIGNMFAFQEKAEAQVVMQASYDELIEHLAFDTAEYSPDHFCGCGLSSAVIVDGEAQYSWSISERGMPIFSEITKLAELLVHGYGKGT